MALETGTRIQDLVATNPVGATDFVSQGDDHLRLIKACVKGSFPNLGSTAVVATAEELNYVDGVTSAIQTQLDAKLSTAAAAAGYQPLDADLTAIAALATAAFGRSLLTASDAAAARTALDAQQLDADLTAIAALTTTAYGRGFLTLADNAALDAKIGSIEWSGEHVFKLCSASQGNGFKAGVLVNDANQFFVMFTNPNGGTNEKSWLLQFNAATKGFALQTANDAVNDGRPVITATRNGIAITNLEIGDATSLAPLTLHGAVKAKTVANSTSTTLVAGQLHNVTGNATLPALDAGDWVAVQNNSGSAITITEHSGDSTYWTAAGVSVATLTVPARGRIVAVGAGAGVVYVSGDVSGYT